MNLCVSYITVSVSDMDTNSFAYGSATTVLLYLQSEILYKMGTVLLFKLFIHK